MNTDIYYIDKKKSIITDIVFLLIEQALRHWFQPAGHKPMN